jgi:CDP-diacylglycerol--glycerol-3-phosphate 3-phosphatidyltransferase
VVDNLDGAVAVMTGRATRWGYVLDSVCDRVADVLFLLAFWLAGAPAWVCLAAGTLTLLQEYARARAGAGGMVEVGVVSVWERPSRVLVTGMFLLAAGLVAPWREPLVELGAALALALAAVGLVQVLVVVRRRLRAADAAEPGSPAGI